MKKNILFIIPGLDVGGAEKSLVNLLSEFDYSKYNVDLFLLNKEGMFIEFLPKEVNILEQGENLKIFSKSLCQSIKEFLVKGNIRLAYSRSMFFLINKLFKNKGKAEQCTWKYLRNAIGKLDKKYDVVIGYLENTPNYMSIDCVQSDKKIGWIHTDYSKLKLDKKFDSLYFNRLNYIVTISKECSDILKREFPTLSEKVKVIKNIVSVNSIKVLGSKEFILKKNVNIIVSVGRLSYEKGFDMAIEACKILINNGIKLVWYVIGEGPERINLERKINEYKLKNNFILVGKDPNPYKYMNKADIYVQPSRFEGKSIAIEEAKILCKPIIVTNFTTAKEQIDKDVNGIIVNMNPSDIAKAIALIISDNIIGNKLRNELERESLAIENELYKFYELIGV